jgi:hypothetical protein
MHPNSNLPQMDHKHPYWGDFSDLYTDLAPTQTAILERAIHLKRIGRFEDAYEIFNHFLPSAHTIPVLAIELSNLYQRQGLDFASSKLLRKTIDYRELWERNVNDNVLTLLNILVAEVETRGYGKLREALTQARTTRELLKDRDISSFSDVEVCQRTNAVLSLPDGTLLTCSWLTTG